MELLTCAILPHVEGSALSLSISQPCPKFPWDFLSRVISETSAPSAQCLSSPVDWKAGKGCLSGRWTDKPTLLLPNSCFSRQPIQRRNSKIILKSVFLILKYLLMQNLLQPCTFHIMTPSPVLYADLCLLFIFKTAYNHMDYICGINNHLNSYKKMYFCGILSHTFVFFAASFLWSGINFACKVMSS